MTDIRVTLEKLVAMGACWGQREKFAELFPDGVDVTRELCVQHVDVFDWFWAADNLLTASARAEYNKVTASARAEYNKVRASAWAEYDKVTASAWAEYDKVIASAWAGYKKVTAPAWAGYKKVTASAFADAYLSDANTQD